MRVVDVMKAVFFCIKAVKKKDQSHASSSVMQRAGALGIL